MLEHLLVKKMMWNAYIFVSFLATSFVHTLELVIFSADRYKYHREERTRS